MFQAYTIGYYWFSIDFISTAIVIIYLVIWIIHIDNWKKFFQMKTFLKIWKIHWKVLVLTKTNLLEHTT